MDYSAQHSVFLLLGDMGIQTKRSDFACYGGRGLKNDSHYISANRRGKDLMFAKSDSEGERFSTFLRIFDT